MEESLDTRFSKLNMDLKLLRADSKSAAETLDLIYKEMIKDRDVDNEENLSQEEFLKLKDKYGALYFTTIGDHEFLYRDLSRAEYYKAISRFEDDETAEEYICNQAVILPRDFDYEDCDAGTPSMLAEQILQESGFTENSPKVKMLLKKFRAEMDLLDNQIPCIIKEAFPDLSLEEIENWNLEKTLKYYTRAEYILNYLQRRGLDFMYEEDIEPQQTRSEFVKPDAISGDMSDPHARMMKAFLEGKIESDETII